MLQAVVRQPALALAFGISAVSSIGLVLFFAFRGDIGMDFSVYWRAAGEPATEVYRPREVLNFPYLPTMLLWIAPLALVPKWLAFISWVAVSIAALVSACRKHVGVVGLVLVSPPVVYCLLNGQVSAALTALLLWTCATPNRYVAGIALAIIVSIKPQFVLLAPLLLLVRRDWAALVSAGVAILVIVAASVFAFGLETWEAWLRSLDHFHSILHTNGVLQVTITPASIAEYWGLPSLPFLLAGAGLGAWIVLTSNESPLHRATAIATGSLLASPYAIMYDLTAVVPFLSWAVYRGSIPAAVAMSGALNPLPLIISGWELKRSARKLRSQA